MVEAWDIEIWARFNSYFRRITADSETEFSLWKVTTILGDTALQDIVSLENKDTVLVTSKDVINEIKINLNPKKTLGLDHVTDEMKKLVRKA